MKNKIIFFLIVFFFLVATKAVFAAEFGGIEIPDTLGLPDPAGGIPAIISNLLNWLLGIFVVLSVIAFIGTGIMYLLALGDSRSQMTENAKNNFLFAIKALLIVTGSVIIIKTIDLFLRGTLTIP